MKDGLSNAPLLKRLREGTAEHHARLDHSPSMRALLARDLTRGDYLSCLERLHPVYAALDRSLVPWISGAALDLDGRRKGPTLARDLSFFGASPKDAAPVPRWTSAAEAWGALYVIEGATLGGMVISKALARHPWFDGIEGRAHFAGYGAETPAMWTRFRQALLAARGTDARFDDAALHGACATFGLFVARMSASEGHAAA